MFDAFNREITIGDIIVRIYDWGTTDLSIVDSGTPAGYLRTIFWHEDNLGQGGWDKYSTMKNGSNLIILDETLLRHHCGVYENRIQAYLEQHRLIKEQL